MTTSHQLQAKANQRFKLKANIVLLAPVFALLSACGGGGVSTDDTTPEVQAASFQAQSAETAAVRPANYVPESFATPSSDQATDPVAAAATTATPATGAPTTVGQSVTDPASTVATAAASSVGSGVASPDSTTTAASTDQQPHLLATITTSSARDPLKQPFASNSIWNMPIGSGAQYVPAKLSGNPGNNIWAKMPGIDDEKIILKPTAPLTNLNYSGAGWSGKDRCTATGGLVVQVPMPSTYVVPNNNLNSSASFLLADGRTVVQTQPLARCSAGAAGTSMAKFATVDLYGTGITGAHGGSGLSAIGGSIRVGELRPGTTTGPRHALKVNVYAKEALYKCTTRTACYRWPAVTSDSYSVGFYGTASNNSNTAMKMGSLLAIPASTNIAALGLETEPAKQLAWTLQNYGAYIVDDTYAPGFDFNVEDGPDGSKKAEFKKDWGYDMEQKVAGNTAWVRDVQRLAKALSVVNNNSATSIGGGGTPRQPLAPAIAK
ncbi:MAG: hypothetical protein WCC39_18680 [Telluria sp.]